MMNNNFSKITLRYAEALFDLAKDKGVLENVGADMEVFQQVCNANRDFLLMLQNPVIHGDKKQKIIKKIFSGKISDMALRFMALMVSKNREHYLPMISSAFTYLYKEHKGIKTAHVTSALPLDDKQKAEILDKLKNTVPYTIELVEHIDKSLIGGFTVDVENYEIDQSLRSHIKTLRKSFEENLFVKGY